MMRSKKWSFWFHWSTTQAQTWEEHRGWLLWSWNISEKLTYQGNSRTKESSKLHRKQANAINNGYTPEKSLDFWLKYRKELEFSSNAVGNPGGTFQNFPVFWGPTIAEDPGFSPFSSIKRVPHNGILPTSVILLDSRAGSQTGLLEQSVPFLDLRWLLFGLCFSLLFVRFKLFPLISTLMCAWCCTRISHLQLFLTKSTRIRVKNSI
jgi:hypothetical protein